MDSISEIRQFQSPPAQTKTYKELVYWLKVKCSCFAEFIRSTGRKKWIPFPHYLPGHWLKSHEIFCWNFLEVYLNRRFCNRCLYQGNSNKMRLFGRCILENRKKKWLMACKWPCNLLLYSPSHGQPMVDHVCLGDLAVSHEIPPGTTAPMQMHKDSEVGLSISKRKQLWKLIRNHTSCYLLKLHRCG